VGGDGRREARRRAAPAGVATRRARASGGGRGAIGDVAAAVEALDRALRFDRVFGRGALAEVDDPAAWLAAVAALLTPDGAVLLTENDPARAQRLSPLVDWSDAEELGARVRQAEATLYADAAAWDEGRWRASPPPPA
jgi:hypothetical protein